MILNQFCRGTGLALAVMIGLVTAAVAQTPATPSAPAGRTLQPVVETKATTKPLSPTAPIPVLPPSPPSAAASSIAASAPASASEPLGVTEASPARPAAGMHELSPWSMFLAADIVVKAVMVGLMFASVVTWTILIGKTIELAMARRRLTKAMKRMGEARMIAEAGLAIQHDGFLSDLLAAASHELDLSGANATRAGVKERSESRFADLVRVETQSMRRGMGVLATIGSTSPFVGLFGTVWGIMNSFIGISKSQTTNLAVVAPGIAEALLATAVGLVAAIPAVIIYNHFSRSTRSYQLLVTRAVGAVTRLLSRELDRNGTAAARAAE
ncbi:tonB-system energizer ExbB [Beijerinckia sp. L45]|uniref:tonB-system energizer ExbB n=1 Tax=Beijerinckia sp. L45 TaxID=1641855 RepID=UPI001FEFEDB6|nr:tonB-system energizer ExbB [Beijerinckia sp. L45]